MTTVPFRKASATFDPVNVPTANGRNVTRLWRGHCTLCDYATEPETGQDAAMTMIQHTRQAHDVPLPGEGDHMPTAG